MDATVPCLDGRLKCRPRRFAVPPRFLESLRPINEYVSGRAFFEKLRVLEKVFSRDKLNQSSQKQGSATFFRALSVLITFDSFSGALQPDAVKEVLAASVHLTMASMHARSNAFSSKRKGPSKNSSSLASSCESVRHD